MATVERAVEPTIAAVAENAATMVTENAATTLTENATTPIEDRSLDEVAPFDYFSRLIQLNNMPWFSAYPVTAVHWRAGGSS